MASKEVTIKDVAEMAGVSLATVSRVINNNSKVAEQTRLKIEGVIARLSFIPNKQAQGLSGIKTRQIGFLNGPLENPFFAELLCLVDREAQKRKYNVLFHCNLGTVESFQKGLQLFASSRVDAMIIVPRGLKQGVLEQFPNIPCFALTAPYPNIPSYYCEGFDGGCQAAQFLLEQECERFIFIGQVQDVKYQGMYTYLLEQGLPRDIAQGDVFEVRESELFDQENIFDLKKKLQIFMKKSTSNLLNTKFGVFGYTDYAVALFQSMCESTDIEHFCFIGFDNNTLLNNVLQYRLHSIKQPLKQMVFDIFQCIQFNQSYKGSNLLKTYPPEIINHSLDW